MKNKRGSTPHAGPKCGSPRKKGRPPCGNAAGAGTAHPGKGRCKLHGGIKKDGTDKRVKHGLRSTQMAALLEQKQKEWKGADLQAVSLLPEIATLRTLGEMLKERPEQTFDVDGFLKVLERLTRAIDVQQRAQRQGMVTLATVQKYTEALGLVIAKHVKEPDVLARIEADAAAIPLLASS